jgi:rhodanese-related sulfurtransferase
MAHTTTVDRIDPREARQHLAADPNALLVCAYDSREKFEQNHLEGAIPLGEFESRAESLPRDREVIFYCA